MGSVTLLQIGPGSSLQDLGREGWTSYGLSRGGAMDRLAIFEAAALLGLGADVSAIELAGGGAKLRVDAPQRVALTGAPMQADADGRRLVWGAVHRLEAGETLSVRPGDAGIYGYVAFGGGLEGEALLGRLSTHFTGGIGRALEAGDVLALGADRALGAPPARLKADDRFKGGKLRFVSGPQTALYSDEMQQAFKSATFRKTSHANRQAAKLEHDGGKFAADGQLGVVSEIIVPGDIQMTGEGEPFVLLAESQTMGGYPRIGAVVEQDIPRIAQARAGSELWFEQISLEEADKLHLSEKALLRRIRDGIEPLVRDPSDISDLLGYQLISGVTAARED